MKLILALDLDGTVVNQFNPISFELVDLMKEFQLKGALIAFVTGRMFSYAHIALKDLDFPYLLALQNGADIVKMPGKSIISRSYIQVKDLQRKLQKVQVPYILYTGIDQGDFCYYQKNLFNKSELIYLEELKKISVKPWREYQAIEEVGDLSIPLVKFFGTKEELIPLELYFFEYSAKVIKDSVDPSKYILLLTSPNASKGQVIKYLKDFKEDSFVIAAGDDRNDIPMFLEANYSIAMPHATEDLKKVATETVAKSLEHSLRKFLL